MTTDYSQPEFYRFNQDSIFLVNWILSQKRTGQRLLDLGAGCGVIGIELARNMHPKSLTLVEFQKEFIPYIKRNCHVFLPENIDFHIIHASFSEMKASQIYDLIVCNPPYYLPGKGQEPKLPQRALARSFIQDNWSVLLSLIEKNLQKRGRAFIVVKQNALILKEIEKAMPKALCLDLHHEHELTILELSTLDID